MMNQLPIKKMQVDYLPVSIYADNLAMGQAAAFDARENILKAISERGEASIILATGNSQLTFLHALKELDGIDWNKVRIFHMDEYLGLAPTHPASFPLFLKEHFIQHVNPRAFHPVPNSPDDIEQACRDYEQLLRDHPADLVAMGWGENGHIAFNDPPDALFNDQQWVKVVELAEVAAGSRSARDILARFQKSPPMQSLLRFLLCLLLKESFVSYQKPARLRL